MVSSNSTTCCIVGGGPAGIFLGYLLARAGVPTTILEKHKDFLRDFRGDTIHPSTMQLMEELGLYEEFQPLIDFQADTLSVNIDGEQFLGPTFKYLDTSHPFIGFVPQWDLLNFMSSQGKRFPEFDLRTETKATDLIREGDSTVGVRWESADAEGEIRADLVVAADGRDSTIRASAHHEIHQAGIPIDVLWFRLDRPEQEDVATLGWLKDGHMLVTIPRRSHYQTAMVIKKGTFEKIQENGLEAFRNTIGDVCPLLAKVAQGIQDWNQVKLLTVQMNQLKKWHEPGLLLIGDAAHAMSPVGGVGINLAIQDAVATANELATPLREQSLTENHLASIQLRRERAARKTQSLQAIVHSMLFGHGAGPGEPFAPPWYFRAAVRLLAPKLRPLAGRWVGLGFQPEHIQTPDVHSGQAS